ncbi:MAG TPA: nucleotidyltransferase domain-containing protein [Candidatus Binatia bacterium]|nr:nucleotidyltransferase domain-containing protein [Candidatus Binatia bacterium]
MSVVTPPLARLVERAGRDPDILAVVLFGSRARAEGSAGSDTDVCLVLTSAVPPGLPSARKRLQFSGDAGIDLVVFQELPLPVRSRVLREGQVLFARDEEALYAVALTTVRDFELFRPIYHAYLDQVGRD